MGLSDQQLVAIVESPDEHYTDLAREAATIELQHRRISNESIKEMALSYQRKRVLDYLKAFNVVNDELRLPKSNILNESEVRELFQQTFLEWKKENDDMIPDSWKYVIGAAFG